MGVEYGLFVIRGRVIVIVNVIVANDKNIAVWGGHFLSDKSTLFPFQSDC